MSTTPPPRPETTTPAKIESLELSGGFLRDVRFEFADGLNCILGDMGVGKTTALELLRFALGAAVPDDEAEAHDARVRGTLGAGRATARVRTAFGGNYESSRGYGEEARVTTVDGAFANVKLDRSIFPFEYAPRGQLHATAPNRVKQRDLLDRFADGELRAIAHEIARIEGRLEQNASELERVHQEIEADRVRVRELPAVEEALRGLALVEGVDPQVAQRAFAEKTARGLERAAMGQVAEVALPGAIPAWGTADGGARRRRSGVGSGASP